MDDEDRQNLQALLSTHRRRLAQLRRQAARFGPHVPPYIQLDIEETEQEIARVEAELQMRTPAVGRASLQQLRRQARLAYFRKQWAQAVDLFIQVVAIDSGDDDSRAKLAEAQRQLQLEDEYYVICELRDAGEWRAVLAALEDLEHRQPGFPDPEGLRQWAADYNLFPIQQNGKYGYIDKSGNIVIEPQFDAVYDHQKGPAAAGSFSEGRAIVKVGDKFGYIDNLGNVVIKNQFHRASYFSEGRAVVKIDNKYGYIDKSGSVVIEPQFLVAETFSEERALVSIDGKYGFIDRLGNIVIQPRFVRAHTSFSEGLVAVEIDDKYGCIDRSGKIVIKPHFPRVFWFSEGLAPAIIDDKLGYIDKSGNTVIKPQFEYAYEFKGGLAVVVISGDSTGNCGCIDTSGNIVIEPQYEVIDYGYSEGLIWVEIDGKYGYIDTTGSIVIRPQFDEASQFSEGLALVEVDGKYGYIDTAGQYIWNPTA